MIANQETAKEELKRKVNIMIDEKLGDNFSCDNQNSISFLKLEIKVGSNTSMELSKGFLNKKKIAHNSSETAGKEAEVLTYLAMPVEPVKTEDLTYFS